MTALSSASPLLATLTETERLGTSTDCCSEPAEVRRTRGMTVAGALLGLMAATPDAAGGGGRFLSVDLERQSIMCMLNSLRRLERLCRADSDHQDC